VNVASPIVFVIEREEVTAGETARTRDFLISLTTTPANARRHFQNIELVFNGYDEDPRELFDIYSVRKFVQTLDQDFPYWLYFMDLCYGGLYAIGMCFLLPELTPEARAVHHPRALGELLTKRWLPALNAMGARTGMSETEINLLTSRCLTYFFKGPEKPPIAN
jgi:hypothetical protein